MRVYDEAALRRLLTPERAIAALAAAFRAFAAGEAAVQGRVRTSVGAVKLSTMGAVLPGRGGPGQGVLEQGVLGAKVYSTVNGAFRFVVLLFDAASGAPLAVMPADALTELRTAAVSLLAARALRPSAEPTALAVFGSGVQAQAHARLLARSLPVSELRLVSRGNAAALAAALAAELGLPVMACGAEAALAGAGLVVTATRAREPLFPAAALAPGACVLAVGATLPEAAELDPALFAAGGRVVVEWLPQAREEAGDLRRAVAAGTLDWERVAELGPLLAGAPVPGDPAAPAVFKSIGIGLEDVALAAAVHGAAPSPQPLSHEGKGA